VDFSNLMDRKEKDIRKFKLGLALLKAMGKVTKDESDPQTLSADQKKSVSFRKLETASGIRHASIVEIVNGKKNASWTTVDAILEGLEMTLAQFAKIYDNLTEDEISIYKKEVTVKKNARERKAKSLRKKNRLNN